MSLTALYDPMGNPMLGGMMYFFHHDTGLPMVTFADEDLAIPHTHPVIADQAGYPPAIFFKCFDPLKTDYELRDCRGTMVVRCCPLGYFPSRGFGWMR